MWNLTGWCGTTLMITLEITQNVIGDNLVLAKVGDEVVGTLHLQPPRVWDNGASMVLGVEVNSNYRRQGIATAMWHYAYAKGLNPRHEILKTPDGEAWAKAVGD